jgi:hypothetical protein
VLPETAIRRVAAGWAGVTATPVEAGADLAYGSVDFGRIRTGLVEAALPPRVREMTIETGRAEPAADRRWALVRVDSEDDVEPAVALLRLAYERARIALAVRDAQRPIS